MKFIVDKLPYFEDECPLGSCGICYFTHKSSCPKHWDKDKVENDNPHECEHLIEIHSPVRNDFTIDRLLSIDVTDSKTGEVLFSL